MLRIVMYTLFMLILICNHAFAFDLDMTVDDEIRKNYNSSKLVKDLGEDDSDTLPELPEIIKTTPQKSMPSTPKANPAPSKILSSGTAKVSKGTTFEVTSNSKISDWLGKGTGVKFTLKKAVTKKHYSIPAGTIFYGEILESHQPQITANGGLVVIRIRTMGYKNDIIPLNAYITKANDKKIFLNNIKGERKYLKTMWKKGNWGRSMFNRMLTLTVKLGGDGSTLLLSPFPFMYGTICLGLNTLTSPICAFFNKGGHVNIPAGSNFKIKLLEDTFID